MYLGGIVLKKGISIGIIALFIVSAVSPMVIGFKSEAILPLNGGNQEEVSIYYYDPATAGSSVTHLGSGQFHWKSAIRLTQEELNPYVGWNLTSIRVYHRAFGAMHEGDIEIYSEGTSSTPGPMIANEEYFFYDDDWFRFELTTPIALDDYNELWIAFDCETIGEDVYFIAVDEGPAIDEKGDWIYIFGEWIEFQHLAYDRNWCIEAIVQGKWNAELSIINISGPIGINAEVKNTGIIDANNLEYTMTVTGGILGGINKTVSGNKTNLAVGETVPINSGLILGLGLISFTITANADNAYEVSTTGTGFIVGPFIFGIKPDTNLHMEKGI